MSAMGMTDTHFACINKGGFMYQGLSVGTAAAALSLATNLTATILTGYKAWYVSYVVLRCPSLI